MQLLVPYYFCQKVRYSILSLSVRARKKIPMDAKKIAPKTSNLRHRPSTRTTCTSELKNVLAYSCCHQRRASACCLRHQAGRHCRHAATTMLPLPCCLCLRHRCAANATNAALSPSCHLRHQAGRRRQRRSLAKLPPPLSWPLPPRCHRASAATAVPFVSIVIVVAVIVAVSVLLINC